MKNPIKAYNRFKKWFERGPQNMGALKIPRFVGYQSATLTFLYWMHYLINTHLTLIGRIMILIGVLMLSYCMFDTKLAMSFIAFSLIALYFINFIVGYIFKPRFKVKRQIPALATCGVTIPVYYEFKNESSLPVYDLKLDCIHYPGSRMKKVVTIPSLPPGTEIKEESKIVFKNRGLFFLPEVFVESSFPFGLCKWGKFGTGSREVRVLPRPMHINRIDLNFITGENEQNLASATDGNGMEFTSCREFRYGDNPRHIHWNSWAKTNIPIIREMTDEGQPALSVIFDNCMPVNLISKYNDIQINFERAISFLAGISEYAKKQNYRIKNLITCDDEFSFTGTDVTAIHNKIMEECSEIKDVRKLQKFDLKPHLLAKLEETKGLILVLLNLDQSRRELIEKLTKADLSLRIFLLGSTPPTEAGPWTFLSYSNMKNESLGDL
ncbi:MAG: DUF58 domain-containing protein [Lentisphaerales bacterium]|nr:DUF58 domain-containing protein [Lentisphaerales bacterium]